MNNRSLLPLGVVLLALAALAVYRFGFESVPDSSFAPQGNPPAIIGQPPPVIPTVKTPPPAQSPRLDPAPPQSAADLDEMFRKRMEAAIAKEDFMEFQRAFLDTFASPLATRELALASLRKQVNHEKIWVRVYIISWMYMMDDRSGRAELMRIAALPEPVPYKTSLSSSRQDDARVSAARIIGRNFDREAASAVLDVHRRLAPPDLLDDLVYMGVPEALGLLRERQSQPPSFPTVELYGYCGEKKDLVYLYNLFTDANVHLDVRLTAAWAITRIEPNDEAASLIQKQAAIRFTDKGYAPLGAIRAVKYLGTLKDPESVKLLERIATEAYSNEVIRTALTNLAYNHATTSAVGREAIAIEARRGLGKLGPALAFRIVSINKDACYEESRRALGKIQAATRWKLTGAHNLPVSYYVLNAPHGQ